MKETKMLSLNQEVLKTVAQSAFDKAASSPRRQRAIDRAKVPLETNSFIHDDGHTLVILSDSSEIYEANDGRQCRAYAQGVACRRRAAARLVKRYHAASH